MMNKVKVLGLFVAVILSVMACEGSKTESSTGDVAREVDLTGNDYLITIKTNLGEMKAVLYDETPQHKANFLKLVNEGFYDSLLFHRVIQGFMIQGGDPNSKGAERGARLGNGGPGYTVPAEINPEFYHKKGALSAARQADEINPERASSGSQFYIVQGQVLNDASISQFSGTNFQAVGSAVQYLMNALPDHDLNRIYREAYEQGGDKAYEEKIMSTLDQLEEATGIKVKSPEMTANKKETYQTIGGAPFLDGAYTVFGQVIDGLDVLDKIAGTQTGPGDRPVEDVVMTVTVEEMPKQEIAEKYGYDFIIQ
ncbi:peptidylprolyl isomerase [Roseivirga sp.]|uniref:peptidylprolyl isomerase n=1 Tax=Roseivirga sp. TaxID=1964215 RepID=UPI003B521455